MLLVLSLSSVNDLTNQDRKGLATRVPGQNELPPLRADLRFHRRPGLNGTADRHGHPHAAGGTIGGMASDSAGHTHAGQVPPGREQWQVEADAAELYQRHLVPAVTAGWAGVLIADVAAALKPHRAAGGLAFPQEAHVLVADR
jgi:hypothetical protein